MTTKSEKVECPTCKSNPGEPCAAMAANGVTRLGYIPIPHSARQVAATTTKSERIYEAGVAMQETARVVECAEAAVSRANATGSEDAYRAARALLLAARIGHTKAVHAWIAAKEES